MKNIFFMIILMFSSQNISSQNILKLGTKWTYSNYLIGGPIQPTYIELIADTVINGTNWFKIEGQGGCAFNQNNPPFIRAQNSKWYVFNVDDQTESILYDFELNTGDTYSISFLGQNSQIEMQIDSTSTIEINGLNRKIQYCSNPNSNSDGFYFGAEIIEGIGSVEYLFPQGNICDPHAGPIRCFENDIEMIDFDIERACDETYFPTVTSDIKNLKIKLYPNPAALNQLVFIESDEIIEHLKIYNLDGEILKVSKPKKLKTQIEIENTGMYYLVIESLKNKRIYKLAIVNAL